LNKLQKEELYHHLMRITSILDKKSETFKHYQLITVPEVVDIIVNYFEENDLFICSEVKKRRINM